jgi:hypothetical protein
MYYFVYWHATHATHTTHATHISHFGKPYSRYVRVHMKMLCPKPIECKRALSVKQY